jgi:hypothetical protein
VTDRQEKPVISVRPEPSPEELAAIVAAVTVAMREAQSGAEPAPHQPETSRWTAAGRRDAMRGIGDPTNE